MDGKPTEIQKADDLKVNKKDFVFEHKGDQLTQFYRVEG